MSVAGIIFSNIHDKNIPELTSLRTMASVPFGSRYRFIDFALSNMVNSGIQKIGVITQYNYHSLLDHIGTGKDWDLATRSGGIKIIPPNIAAFTGAQSDNYLSRLDALKSATVFISRCTEDYTVLSDCDVICNLDLNDMIEYHVNKGADITLATKKQTLTRQQAQKNVLISADENGRVNDLSVYPTAAEDGEHCISLNIVVLKTRLLEGIVHDAIAHGYTSFNVDVLLRNISSLGIYSYDCRGYFACVSSVAEYFECSMQLLLPEIRHELFGNRSRPILTKVRNSPPARYTDTSEVHNSLIADGCVIEGKVENSILFRGVKVCKGAHVRNSIIMQDGVILGGATVNCTVIDKDVLVRDGRLLSGHETRPFYIEKGARV